MRFERGRIELRCIVLLNNRYRSLLNEHLIKRNHRLGHPTVAEIHHRPYNANRIHECEISDLDDTQDIRLELETREPIESFSIGGSHIRLSGVVKVGKAYRYPFNWGIVAF